MASSVHRINDNAIEDCHFWEKQIASFKQTADYVETNTANVYG